MTRIDTVVIGGGQAGLAVSHELTARGRDHVVLERHELGARWRRETWDSLRLLTPNWMNVLPGAPATGTTRTGSPRRPASPTTSTGTPPRSAPRCDAASPSRSCAGGATASRSPRRPARGGPATSSWPPAGATSRSSRRWPTTSPSGTSSRPPTDVPATSPPGGVLVVGASATGVQLAHELRLAGRDVTLAVGRHTRVPRRVPRHGHLLVARPHRRPRPDDRHDARRGDGPAGAVAAARRPARPRSLDLLTLQAIGVRLVGRVIGAAGHRRGPRSGPRPGRRRRRAAGRRPAGPHRRPHRRAPAWAPRCSGPRRCRRCARRRLRPSSTCGRRHPHRRVGDRPPPRLPVAAGAGARRRRRDPPAPRASHRSPACTCSASASSTAGAPTSSAASGSTPTSSPPTSRRPPPRRGAASCHDRGAVPCPLTHQPDPRPSHRPARESLRRDRRRCPRRRRGHGPPPRPPRRSTSCSSTAAATAPTPCRRTR